MGRLFLRTGSVVEGPLPEAEVVQRLRRGAVPEGTLGSADGRADWRPLETWPALRAAISDRRRAAAPTWVGARAPVVDDGLRGGVELSLSGEGPPEVMAVPRGGERARRPVSRVLVFVGVALLGLLAVGAAVTVYWLGREPEPLRVRIEEVQVEVADRTARAELADEVIVVRVRTSPRAAIRVSGGPEARADDVGLATARYFIGQTREPTVEILVVATLPDGREGRERATVERPHRLRQRGDVAECSTRPCALGVEADGALTVSGIGPSDTLSLGDASAQGAVPDAADAILAAISPDALFASPPETASLPLRFELEDGAVLEGSFPIAPQTARRTLFDRFEPVADGAVHVPGSDTGRAILWIGDVGEGRSASGMALVGSAASVSAIGRVAIVEVRTRRRRCGRYGSGDAQRTVYVEQRNAVVRLYDRRRGRLLRTRTVSAPRLACPRQVTLEPGEGDAVAATSSPESSEVEAWLSTQR